MIEFSTVLRTFALATDPRVWFILLVLGAAVFGRAGFFRSRWFNLIKPWRNRPASQSTAASARPEVKHPLRDPLFIFLLVIATSAVVAWIVMSWTVGSQRSH